MGVLDTPLRSVVSSVLGVLGSTSTLVVFNRQAYNPRTGQGSSTETRYNIQLSIPASNMLKEIDRTSIQIGDMEWIAAAKDLSVVPQPDNFIEMIKADGSNPAYAWKAVKNGLDNLVTSSSPSVAIFSSLNDSTPQYVRNADCWARKLNLTSFCPWNSAHTQVGTGILVSPQNLICNDDNPVEGSVRFITKNNEIITRSVDSFDQYNTLRIIRLDEPVPDSISFAKVLPDNWADYLPDDGEGLPVFYSDYEREVHIAELVSLAGTSCVFASPAVAARLPYYEAVVDPNDIGNPLCFAFKNQPIVLGILDGELSAESIWDARVAINAVLTSFNDGYQLTAASFSDYAKTTDLSAIASKDRYRIVAVEPIYSGEQICAYWIQGRK